MALTANTIRTQLFRLKPLLEGSSLESSRKAQSMIGELLEHKHSRRVMIKEHTFEDFVGAWVVPHEERRQGVILYLHGGGFVCGDLQYAKGFAAMLAVECGVRTFCPAYRLAPEHPFPAALDDAMTAYRYLLSKGYAPSHITLCGESAGGGLCYSLCLRLRELGLPMPAGIIAISPWADLTLSGESYQQNSESDPTLSYEKLSFFAECYTKNVQNLLASPMLADLSDLPPSVIFAAQEEIVRSDSETLHERLKECGCISKLLVKPDRWHAYLLYGLAEDRADFGRINRFLTAVMSPERMLRWMRLDNAAKIYPAARSKSWSNVFRVSVTFKERVDKDVLRTALDVTARRFPSICARLRKGMFWYYLEQLSEPPKISKEYSYPLTRMYNRDIRKCALRVIVYENRVALEFFHALTDGTGAMIFLKALTAEYIQQKYGVSVPAEHGVLGRLDEPSAAELEDSFQKYAGPVAASRKERDAYHLSGTPESSGFINLTCFRIPVQKILDAAHEKGVSLTVYLTSAMMLALQRVQAAECPTRHRQKPIKILVPVNLRRLFPSRSLRNFALYTTPEIDPRLGDYTFDEICKIVHHWLASDVTPKKMAAKIATNIESERILIVRLMPLFIKNLVMKAVYSAVGERKSCFCMSNLGKIELPQIMKEYVARFDFILGVQATVPYNCGILSYGDHLYMNFVRNIRESNVELQFFKVLQELGIPVLAESNQQ